jgi:hypothetical protein
MENSISCFLNKLINAQLNPGSISGEGGGSPSASDLFQMLPYMAIPTLLVMIGGLYMISIYRRKRLKN